MLAERDKGGAPCRQVHALLAAKLSDIERDLAALARLKEDLEVLLGDWTARLAATPSGRQARLLDTLPPRRPTGGRRRGRMR